MPDEIYISRILALSVLSHVTLAKLTLSCVSSVVKWSKKIESLFYNAWYALNHLLVIIIIIIKKTVICNAAMGKRSIDREQDIFVKKDLDVKI